MFSLALVTHFLKNYYDEVLFHLNPTINSYVCVDMYYHSPSIGNMDFKCFVLIKSRLLWSIEKIASIENTI